MAKLVTGLFDHRADAMLAAQDLMRHGFSQENLSLLNTDTTLGREFFTDIHSKAPEGAALGAILGALACGAVMACIRLGYLNAPSLGLENMGLLPVVLIGVAIGATSGLLVGGIVGSDIPEYEVNFYRTDKRHGGILLGIYTHIRRLKEVRKLMEAAGGHDIRAKEVSDEALPGRQKEFSREADKAGNRGHQFQQLD